MRLYMPSLSTPISLNNSTASATFRSRWTLFFRQQVTECSPFGGTPAQNFSTLAGRILSITSPATTPNSAGLTVHDGRRPAAGFQNLPQDLFGNRIRFVAANTFTRPDQFNNLNFFILLSSAANLFVSFEAKTLFPFKSRNSFFDECRHAFFAVFGFEKHLKALRLVFQTRKQIGIHSVIDRLFDHLHGHR